MTSFSRNNYALLSIRLVKDVRFNKLTALMCLPVDVFKVIHFAIIQFENVQSTVQQPVVVYTLTPFLLFFFYFLIFKNVYTSASVCNTSRFHVKMTQRINISKLIHFEKVMQSFG